MLLNWHPGAPLHQGQKGQPAQDDREPGEGCRQKGFSHELRAGRAPADRGRRRRRRRSLSARRLPTAAARQPRPAGRQRERGRVFTIPVPIPFRFHFGSGSRIFESSSLYDSICYCIGG